MNSSSLIRRLLVFLYVLNVGSAFCQGQETDWVPPFAIPPKLNFEFKDNFNPADIEKYALADKKEAVKWDENKVVVEEGGTIARPFEGGAWARLDIDLQFKQKLEKGQSTEFRVWLDFANATDSYLVFRQALEGEETKSSIAVFDTGDDWSKGSVDPRRASRTLKINGQLAPGTWTIEYRLGLWKVTGPGGQVSLFGYVENGSSRLKGVVFNCVAGEHKIQTVKCRYEEYEAFEMPKEIDQNIDRIDELSLKVNALIKGHEIKNAIGECRKLQKLREKAIGKYHVQYSLGQGLLGRLLYTIGDYKNARSVFEELVELDEQIFGVEHPNYSASLDNFAVLCSTLGDYSAALDSIDKSKVIIKKVYGKQHPDYSLSINNQSQIYNSIGEYKKAEQLLVEAKSIAESVAGKFSRSHAVCVVNLASLYETTGDYDRAKDLFLDATEITKEVFGELSAEHAVSLNNQANLFRSVGVLEKAEPLFLKAKSTWESIGQTKHQNYATTLSSLGAIYYELGALDKAEELLLKAHEIIIDVLGEDHSRVVVSLNDIASMLSKKEEFEKAVQYSQKAKALAERNVAKTNPIYAKSIRSFALHLYDAEKYEQAKTQLVEAVDIYKKVYGKHHIDYLLVLANLGCVLIKTGELEEAESILGQAMDSIAKSGASKNRQKSGIIDHLISLKRAKGEFEQAESLLVKNLTETSDYLARVSVILSQSEYRHFSASLEHRVSNLISNCLQLENRGGIVIENVIGWKGLNLLREKSLAKLAHLESTKSDFAKLQSIRSQISLLSQNAHQSNQLKSRFNELISEEERLQKRLMMHSSEIGIGNLENSIAKCELPPRSVFVDYRRFVLSQPDKSRPGRFLNSANFLATIRASDGQVHIVDLGNASKILDAIAQWRRPIEQANRNSRAIDVAEQESMNEAGIQLRKLIWDPIEKHFGESELVIVSPDGALGRIPLIALPGQKDGTYLIEDRKIVYLPVPALLPEILSKPVHTINANTRSLLFGGIDYGNAAEIVSPDGLTYRNQRILGNLKFSRLEKSEDEIKGIKGHFDFTTLASEKSASENRFKKLVADHQLLHVATHGFFVSPDRFMSNLSSQDQQFISSAQEQVNVLTETPNLLSGLAFAEANRASSKSIDEEGDDGILYSAEISLIPMDHVELAVLSACDTAIGQDTAPGQGLIGIQRAFQVAGAKSTVASYWKVNDAATQMLMNKFYENLIKYGEQAKANGASDNNTMVRINALRDAQLWMLRGLKEEQVAQLTRGPDKETKLGGVTIKKVRGATEEQMEYVSHPRYWAAFVLSGDWR